mmetsp:Transcript_77745/g.210228  ORF Transcript_77745/g.210228 Transcript_77745/m.210228 type:complete len:273 (+) Transcript_77745:400-1218(+)
MVSTVKLGSCLPQNWQVDSSASSSLYSKVCVVPPPTELGLSPRVGGLLGGGSPGTAPAEPLRAEAAAGVRAAWSRPAASNSASKTSRCAGRSCCRCPAILPRPTSAWQAATSLTALVRTSASLLLNQSTASCTVWSSGSPWGLSGCTPPSPTRAVSSCRRDTRTRGGTVFLCGGLSRCWAQAGMPRAALCARSISASLVVFSTRALASPRRSTSSGTSGSSAGWAPRRPPVRRSVPCSNAALDRNTCTFLSGIARRRTAPNTLSSLPGSWPS